MTNGIRITQEGVDVKRAADYQHILHEQWPYLEFEFIGDIELNETVVGENNNVFIPFYEHDLPYTPPFIFIKKSVSPQIVADTFFVAAVDKKIGITTQTYGGETRRNVHVSGWLAVIKRDITKEYTSPSKDVVPGPFVGPQKHGIKVVKRGARMAGKDKRHYTLHTNAKALAIHKHGKLTADAASVYKIIIEHDLGYPPTYFLAAYGDSTQWQPWGLGKKVMEPLNAVVTIATANARTMEIRGAQGTLFGDYVYLVLKDPVDVAR